MKRKAYNNITLRFLSPGHYLVAAMRENDVFAHYTTDMQSVDLIKSEGRGWKAASNRLFKDAVKNGFKTIIG